APGGSAGSAMLGAIGPCTPRVRSRGGAGLRAPRPMLGRMPTTPQKLAGLRSDPPVSLPCATQAVPEASAAAAPPDDPAAERARFHGLSVAPKTSLKVLAPAPNSGVFDLA